MREYHDILSLFSTCFFFLSVWKDSTTCKVVQLEQWMSKTILLEFDYELDHTDLPYRAKFFQAEVRIFWKVTKISPDKVSPNQSIIICMNDLLPLRFNCTSTKDTFTFLGQNLLSGESHEFFIWWRKFCLTNSFTRLKFAR